MNNDYTIVRGCVRTPKGLLIGSAYVKPPAPQSADHDALQSCLLRKPAPVKSERHRQLDECCGGAGDCDQGKRCPERTPIDWIDALYWSAGCALLVGLCFVVGAAYRAGVLTGGAP